MAIEQENKALVAIISQALESVLLKNDASLPEQNDCYTASHFFSLTQAKKLAETAEAKARQMGVAISIAVVDLSGNLVLFQRMPDTVTASVVYAQNKAYTAAIYQWPSHKMDELIQPVSAMTALLNIDPKVTSLGGGLPITINKQIIGGLGISGGALSQDIEIAQYVLRICCGQ